MVSTMVLGPELSKEEEEEQQLDEMVDWEIEYWLEQREKAKDVK